MPRHGSNNKELQPGPVGRGAPSLLLEATTKNYNEAEEPVRGDRVVVAEKQQQRTTTHWPVTISLNIALAEATTKNYNMLYMRRMSDMGRKEATTKNYNFV